ncbi:hypothetical protein BT93_F1221 [Corymbia citriodora subsp. variegata]|nr:hypothetical protein BT93_F1221 [Corymbia citriodora subsp. variegata]
MPSYTTEYRKLIATARKRANPSDGQRHYIDERRLCVHLIFAGSNQRAFMQQMWRSRYKPRESPFSSQERVEEMAKCSGSCNIRRKKPSDYEFNPSEIVAYL